MFVKVCKARYPLRKQLKSCLIARIIVFGLLDSRFADMAELADAHGSGPCAAGHVGSTPIIRTTNCPKTIGNPMVFGKYRHFFEIIDVAQAFLHIIYTINK